MSEKVEPDSSSPDPALELDHVLLAVDDLASAARLLQDRCGLASVEGGRHPDWGTANRLVPLGGAYLELLAVVDEDRARTSPFGSWVAGAHPAPLRPLGWAVRTRDIAAAAARLGLGITSGQRACPDGTLLLWRLAGLDEAAVEPFLPFIIEWGEGTPHPGDVPVSHRVADVRIARLHLDGDGHRLAEWLDGHQLAATIRSGVPALTAVTLATSEGEITIDANLR